MKNKRRKINIICVLLVFLSFLIINTVQANVVYGAVLFNEKPLEGAIVDIGCDNEPTRTNQDGMYAIETLNCKNPLDSPVILKACINDTRCPETTELIDSIPDIGIKKDFDIKSCTPEYNVRFYLKTLKEEDIMSESEYQNPLRFKENDYLRLEKFEVTNSNDCKIAGMGFSINLIKPNGQKIDVVFGSGGSFYIKPALGKKDAYTFERIEQIKESNEGVMFIKNYYKDSFNGANLGSYGFRGTQQLLDVGVWTLIGELRDIEGFPYPKEKPKQVSIQIITNNNEIREPSFKVKQDLDIIMVSAIKDLANSSNRLETLTWWLLIITFLLAGITFFGILYQIKLSKSTEDTFKNIGSEQIKNLKDIADGIGKSSEEQLVIFKNVGEKQIEELKSVSKNIQDSTKKQLEEIKKFENKKIKNTLSALLKELEFNYKFSQELIAEEELYKEKGITPMRDFVLDVINLVLSRYLIQDEKINKRLISIRDILNICNIFIKNCRDIMHIIENKERCSKHMGKVIKNIKSISPIIEITKKDIAAYMGKL